MTDFLTRGLVIQSIQAFLRKCFRTYIIDDLMLKCEVCTFKLFIVVARDDKFSIESHGLNGFSSASIASHQSVFPRDQPELPFSCEGRKRPMSCLASYTRHTGEIIATAHDGHAIYTLWSGLIPCHFQHRSHTYCLKSETENPSSRNCLHRVNRSLLIS